MYWVAASLRALVLARTCTNLFWCIVQAEGYFSSSLQWVGVFWFSSLKWFCTGLCECWSWHKGKSRNMQPERGKSLCHQKLVWLRLLWNCSLRAVRPTHGDLFGSLEGWSVWFFAVLGWGLFCWFNELKGFPGFDLFWSVMILVCLSYIAPWIPWMLLLLSPKDKLKRS